MTSPVSAIEAIEKAMEGVTPGPWQTVQTRTDIQRLTVAGPSEIVCGLDGICEPDRMNDRLFGEDAANMRYIAACNPVAMREVLALARQAEALTGIGSAHDLISDWLGEGTDDLPDDTPVRIEIGKRTIISDNLGSLRRARALLGGSENAGN